VEFSRSGRLVGRRSEHGPVVRDRLRPLDGAFLGLTAILGLAAGTISWASGGIALFADQWKWIFDAEHPTVGGAFQDWDSHLMASTFGLFDLLPRVVGLSDVWPYRFVSLVLHLGIVWAVFALASRRVGPRLALVPAAILAFLGSGGEAFLTSLDYNELIATLACLLALLCVEKRTVRADLGACVLLLVGVASFTNALAYAAGLAVELFMISRLRRVWIALTPVALYAVWRLEHGLPTAIAGHPSGHPLAVVRETVQIAAGAFAGVAGIQLATMPHASLIALAVALVVLFALLLAVRERLYRDARLLNLIVAGAVLWLLIAYARGALNDLYGSRYVYQGAVVAVLILVELWAPLAGRARLAVFAVVAAALTSVALNTHWLFDAGSYWRSLSTSVRAKLTALDIARDTASSDYRPSREWAFEFITAGRYFNAVHAFGSAGLTDAQLRRDAEPERQAADRVLIGASEIRLGRLAHTPTCMNSAPRHVQKLVVRASSRLSLVASSNASIRVSARRFADTYTHVGDLSLARRGATQIGVTLGHAQDPWHLRITSTGPIRVCPRP
jgi:hypothetical protein